MSNYNMDLDDRELNAVGAALAFFAANLKSGTIAGKNDSLGYEGVEKLVSKVKELKSSQEVPELTPDYQMPACIIRLLKVLRSNISPEAFQIVRRACEQNFRDSILLSWDTEDVLSAAEYSIDEQTAIAILRKAELDNDCNFGINWDTFHELLREPVDIEKVNSLYQRKI